jgi:hypothetical protein
MASRAEARSRRVAEEARETQCETQWKKASFLRELFLGAFHLEWVSPFARTDSARSEFKQFYDVLKGALAL